MEELQKYIIKMKYLVLNENITKVYSSLRNMADEIKVDFSTISKKLKENKECFCISKETKINYFIKKLC